MGYQKRNAEGFRRGKRNSKMSNPLPMEIYFEGEAGAAARAEREKDTKAVKKFNASIRKWGYKVKTALASSMVNRMEESTNLRGSLKVNFKYFGKRVPQGKEITSLGFSFAAEGIYVHLGVGRGYNMQNGTVVVTKKHNRDQVLRHPNPWFSPVVERFIPELQTILTDYCADMVVDATSVNIKV